MDNIPSPAQTPTLAEVLKKYEISLPAKQVALLEQYCTELWKWNEQLNLTRHTDYEKFVAWDVMDAIHVAAHLQKGEHVLDFGTGGGMPGVILAILRPDITVELCDATGKKTSALGQILEAMKLDLNVWYAKGEELLKVHRFHTIVIRAVGKIEQLLRMFSPVWYAFDRLLLVKGIHWVDERGEARHYGLLNKLALRKLDEYINPGADNPSCILQICQKGRFEELKEREADLLAGKPINQNTEKVGVDNKPAPQPKKPAGAPSKTRYSKKGQAKKSDGTFTPAQAAKRSYTKKSRSSDEQSSDHGFQRSSGSRDKKQEGSKGSYTSKRGKGWVHPEKPLRRETPKKKQSEE